MKETNVDTAVWIKKKLNGNIGKGVTITGTLALIYLFSWFNTEFIKPKFEPFEKDIIELKETIKEQQKENDKYVIELNQLRYDIKEFPDIKKQIPLIKDDISEIKGDIKVILMKIEQSR